MEVIRQIKEIKNIDTLLDTAWSQLVKLLGNNKCAYCNSEQDLHSHHIHTRKNKSTRWDTDNGICLCEDHHVYNTFFSAHKTPQKFMEWMRYYKGKEFTDRLCCRANSTVKRFNFEKQELLEDLQNQIKEFK